MTSKVLDVMWYNGCGIVKVEDDYDGIKYYIREIKGYQTEEDDARYVADWGSTFPKDVGDLLFKQYGRG